MSDDGWISINGWDEFQHVDVKRGSGPPPWIKNYTRLMNDDDYLDLTEHCALVLHRLWLTYASSRCQLRATTSSLSRRLGVRVMTRDLERLSDAGFITIVASKSQAEGQQHAGTTRARVEVEVEEEKTVTETVSVEQGALRAHGDGDGEEEEAEPRQWMNGHRPDGYELPAPAERPEVEGSDEMQRLQVVADMEDWAS